jgi:Holliday junction resolvase
MGKASREKGKRGERELAAHLREFGYDSRRGQQYCGGNGDADVIGLPGIHIECKRVEKLSLTDAMTQAIRDSTGKDKLPAVFHRKNREGWMVTMRLEDWIEIYREWEAGMDLENRSQQGNGNDEPEIGQD